MAFRKGNELEFAKTGQTQRCVGNKVNKVYEIPVGWEDGPQATLEELAPAGACLVCLQPDTNLDLSPSSCVTHTYIKAFKRTEELIEHLQEESAESLQDIMGLGRKMAASHLDRFKKFEKLPPKQACLLFGGKALRAEDFSSKEQQFAELHMRMITGLYGSLRPYDDVKPVRDVPMGARIKTKAGSSILDFWGASITKQLVKDCEELGKKFKGRLQLACAMDDDYWKAIQGPALPRNVEAIQVLFEGANDEETRRGRSLFARYGIRKKIENLDGIRDFDHDDWKLDARKSGPYRVIFNWDGGSEGAATEKELKKKEKKRKKEREARARSRSASSSVHEAEDDGGLVTGVIEDASDSDDDRKVKVTAGVKAGKKMETIKAKVRDVHDTDSDDPLYEKAPPEQSRRSGGSRHEGAKPREDDRGRDRGDRRGRERGDRSRSQQGRGSRRAPARDSRSPPRKSRR